MSPEVKNRVLQPKDIVVTGVPFDGNSSFRRGASLAPPRIREALWSDSANLWTETAVDLGRRGGWHWGEAVDCADQGTAMQQIEDHVRGLLGQGARVLSLGGDHSVTLPIMRAHGKVYADLTLVYLDAHPDLYDELDGNRESHACPCARIMEEGLVKRLVQVGIRTLTGHQREQAERFGVEIIEMREIERVEALDLRGPVYLSLDLDCLDPAFAPGVSHWEPGGLSTREVLKIMHQLGGELVGADIVEYNPERDTGGITGMVAAKFLKEILGRMLLGDEARASDSAAWNPQDRA